jgi:hypothetical protein
MKKRLLVLVLLMITALGAWAQEGGDAAQPPANTSENLPEAAKEQKPPYASDLFPNALGFSVGTNITPIAGFNLHYQRWMRNLGVAASIGAIKGGIFGEGLGADVLVTLQYKLSQAIIDTEGNFCGALYVYANSGYFFRQGTELGLVGTQYVPVGIGIGLEAIVYKHISVPLELGYEYHIMTDYLGPAFIGAIRYRF